MTTAYNLGEFDAAKQQNQVKDFIVKKVAAIVLTPCDSKAIGPAIKEATAASRWLTSARGCEHRSAIGR